MDRITEKPVVCAASLPESRKSRMGLLVLNVDHLPTHLLGPYGNTSVPTPTLNRWAANGIVVDGAFKSGPQNRGLLDAICQPNSPLPLNHTQPQTSIDLCFSPAEIGHPNWFPRSDNPRQIPASLPLGSHPGSPVTPAPSNSSIPTILHIPQSAPQRVAKVWETTSTARYCEQVFHHLSDLPLRSDHHIWINLPLLSGDWDAPLEWRNFLANDEDLETYRGWQPPHLQRQGDACSGFDETHGFDPDQRLAYEHAAGAMIILLDHACEWLESGLSSLPRGHDLAILLTAESGFSLGEHFSIGRIHADMWAEESHVPIILHTQFPNQYPARIPGIQDQTQVVQRWCQQFANTLPASQAIRQESAFEELVNQSLRQFGAVDYSIFSSQQRSAVLSFSPAGVSCRTVNWSFLWHIDQAPRLFVRPDDRAEQNDVASRCRDVVAAFQWHLPDIAHALGHQPNQLPQLQNDNWSIACRTLEADGLSPANMTWAQQMENVQREQFTSLDQLPETLWQARV